MKIPPVESYLIHPDGRTEGKADKRTVRDDEANCR